MNDEQLLPVGTPVVPTVTEGLWWGWCGAMDKCIGYVGEVIECNDEEGTRFVMFSDEAWWFPMACLTKADPGVLRAAEAELVEGRDIVDQLRARAQGEATSEGFNEMFESITEGLKAIEESSAGGQAHTSDPSITGPRKEITDYLRKFNNLDDDEQ